MSPVDAPVLPGLDWSSRPVQPALSAEHLSVLLADTACRSGELLFTGVSASRLDEVARWQRLEDLAWCGKVQALIALQSSSQGQVGEFVADEVALALGVGMMTAGNALGEALEVAALPALLVAVQDGVFTVRHVKAVLRTLAEHDFLSQEQRGVLVERLLARHDDSRTPGRVAVLLRRLVLTLDLHAAQRRKEQLDADRAVRFHPGPDGQASLYATGPAEVIATIRASLAASLPPRPDPGDPRSTAARQFDLFTELLTGTATPGQWHASIIVPFHTATGGELELADLPGLGPVLPATARDLLAHAQTSGGLTRISIDTHGRVTHLDTPRSRPDMGLTDLLAAFTLPPQDEDLSSTRYRVPERLRRLVQARDLTCVFPLCHQPAARTDTDHRSPWPRGATTTDNLHSLCRHHHRAKQAGHTPTPLPDGTLTWTTPSGWRFTRPPHTH